MNISRQLRPDSQDASHGRIRQNVALALIVAILATTQPTNLHAIALSGTAEERVPAPQAAETNVIVMTFNLGDGLVDPADLVSYLRSSGASLVALQEVTPEIAQALETDLGDVFPYREVRGLGIPGKALLSQYPITRVEWLEFNPGRPDLHATVDIAGRPVEVLVAHPPPVELNGVIVQPREGSVEQFDRLIEIADGAEGPFLLLGDLNVTPLHRRYRELESIGLTDVFGAVGSGAGFTFPLRIASLPEISISPAIRIDYIWVSEHWHALSASVGEDIGSDHLPVIGHIALLDES